MPKSILHLLLTFLLVFLVGCSADEPQPLTGPENESTADESGALAKSEFSGAALIVGDWNWPVPPGGNAFRRYDESGTFIDDMIPDYTGGIDGTVCMAFGPDQNLYATSWFAGVLRYNGLTGEFIDEFVAAGSGGLICPLVPVFHGDYLYVGDVEAHAIFRYMADTGDFVDIFVEPGSQGMTGNEPQHFAFGPDDNLYVAAETTSRVLRYDGQTGAFIDEFVPVDPEFSGPSGLVFGPDGLLYVGALNSSVVRRYDVISGDMEVFIPAGGGGLSMPVGMDFGPDGNFYVASLGNPSVLRYDGMSGAFMDVFVPDLAGPRMILWMTKIMVCHCPPGRPDNCKTLNVDYLNGFDHIAHGDELGQCAEISGRQSQLQN